MFFQFLICIFLSLSIYFAQPQHAFTLLNVYKKTNDNKITILFLLLANCCFAQKRKTRRISRAKQNNNNELQTIETKETTIDAFCSFYLYVYTLHKRNRCVIKIGAYSGRDRIANFSLHRKVMGAVCREHQLCSRYILLYYFYV